MNNLNMITEVLGYSEYSGCINSYFKREFPNPAKTSKTETLEILADIFFGTKETRFGPLPSPESQVAIREVIRYAIEGGLPIPMRIPFGGIKADRTGDIDIAELVAIKRVAALNDAIRMYYPPGIRANILIEDVNAVYLYGKDFTPEITRYSANLSRLVEIIAEKTGIWPVRESHLFTQTQYEEQAEKSYPLLLNYLTSGVTGYGTSYDALLASGWKGEIPEEQRAFYRDRYMNLYPGMTYREATEMMARYFAGSKARYDLKKKGNPSEEEYQGKFIQLSFVQPVPGAPENMFSNVLYYRTLPLSEARSHMPAWRSKGYLKIDGKNSVKAKITNFHDTETLSQLQPMTVKVSNDTESVIVRADFLLE